MTSFRCASSFIFAFASVLLGAPAFAQSNFPSDFTVEGRLFDSSGNPLNQSGVTIMLELVDDSNANCVLYREVHTSLNLSSGTATSQGVFALRLGSGTPRYNPTPFTTLFTNAAGMAGALEGTNAACSPTPSATTHRMVKVKVWDSTGGGTWTTGIADTDTHWDALSPDTKITVAPQAMVADNAESLNGHLASDFLLGNTNATLTQSNLESIFSGGNYTKLLQLLSGASNQYVNTTPTGDVNLAGHKLTNLNLPTVGTDATNKTYVDASLGGKTLDITGVGPGLGGGSTLVWDQVQNKWVAQTTLSYIGAGNGLKGGPITTTGTLSVDTGTTANKILQLNASAQIPAVDGSLLLNVSAASLQGRAISAAAPVAQQVLGWNSASSQWEPQSSTGGTVTGLSGDVTGSGSGVIATTLADNAVTSTKISANAVTSAKINNTGVAVNRLLITDATTGASVTYASCNPGEVLQWTASGWTCESVALMLGASGVTAGTYGNGNQIAQVGVNAQGRVVSLTNVNIAFPVISVAGRTGAVTLSATDVSGLGTAATQNVGTAANNVLQFTTAGQLPGLDGSLLTNVTANAISLQGRAVSSATPTGGQLLAFNSSTSQWEPSNNSGVYAAKGANADITSLGAIASISGPGNIQIQQATNSTLTLGASGGTSTVNVSSPTINLSGTSTTTVGSSAGSAATVIQSGTSGVNITSGANINIQPSNTGSVTVGSGTSNGAATFGNTSGAATTTVQSGTGGIRLSSNAGVAVLLGSANSSVGFGTTTPQIGTIADFEGIGTGQSAILLPHDTAVNRPSGVNGMLRYNTSNGTVEAFQAGTWQSLGGSGGPVVPTFPLAGPGGSTAAPDYATGNATTGMYSNVANTLMFAAGGSQVAKFDSAGNVSMGGTPANMMYVTAAGRLGLGGDTAPSADLAFATGAAKKITVEPPATAGVSGNDITLAAGDTKTGSSNTTGGNLNLSTGMSTGSPGASAVINMKVAVAGGSGTTSNTPTTVAAFNQFGLAVGATPPASITSPFTVINPNANSVAGDALVENDFAGTIPAALSLSKTRGGASLTVGDTIGELRYEGMDSGAGTVIAAKIASKMTSITAGNGAGDLEFYTSLAGVPANRMTISSAGMVGIGQPNPSVALDVVNTTSGQSAIILPRDTQANRPPVGVNGMIRYNTNLAAFEGFANGAWGTIGGVPPSLWLTSGSNIYYNVGKVGIGTSAPGAQLEVDSTSGYSIMGSSSSATQFDAGVYGTNSSNGSGVIGYSANGYGVVAETNAATSAALYATNYGGGTLAALQASTASTSPLLVVEQFGTSTADLIEAQNSSASPLFVVTSKGYVGIGNAVPTVALDVANTTSGKSAIIVPRDTAANRPPVGVNGMIRYNTNIAGFEGFSNGAWGPLTALPAPGVTAVTSGNGLLGGTITSNGTLSVDVGATANKIVQLDSSARLPGVDGGLLTNLNAARIANRNVSATAPSGGSILGWNTTTVQWEPFNSINFGTGNITAGSLNVAGALGVAYPSGTSVPNGIAAIIENTASTDSDAAIAIFRPHNAASNIQNAYIGAISTTGAPVYTPSIVLGQQTGSSNFAERMRIDPNGNVGVGTTTPGYKLDVAGAVNATAMTINGVPVGTGNGSVSMVSAGTGLTGGTISTTGTLNVDVGATANKIVQLDSSARIPAVDGSQLTNINAVKLQSVPVSTNPPSAGTFLGWNNAIGKWDPLPQAWQVNGSNVFVSSGNNVGIGTSTPTKPLDISLSSGSDLMRLQNSSLGGPSSLLFADYNGISRGSIGYGNPSYFYSSAMFINAGASTPLVLATNSTERMRVDMAGNVGIGTTTPAYKLDVAGPMNATAMTINGVPVGMGNGSVNMVSTGVGLVGGSITTIGTLSVDVGTTANKIVQLTAAGKLPSVDGSLLFNLPVVSSQWTTAGSNIYYNTGGVGIGTTTPLGALDVRGGTAAANTNGAGIYLYAQNGGTGTSNGGNIYLVPGTPGSGSPGVVEIGTGALPGGLGQNTLYAQGGLVGPVVNISTGFSGVTWGTGSTSIMGMGASGSGDYLQFKTNSVPSLYISGTGNVGIGTASPGAHLDSASNGNDSVQSTGYGSFTYGNFLARSAEGSMASPSLTLAGDALGNFGFSGYSGTNFMQTAGIQAIATQNFAASSGGTQLQFVTTANGTSTKMTRMIIDQNGYVGIGTTTPSALLEVAGEFKARHIGGSSFSTATTVALGTGAGTSPTLTAWSGTDAAQKITITTGSGGTTASVAIFTVTFATPYASPPVCVFSPGNQVTATLSSGSAPWISITSGSSYSLMAGPTALFTSTAYSWYVHCFSQ